MALQLMIYRRLDFGFNLRLQRTTTCEVQPRVAWRIKLKKVTCPFGSNLWSAGNISLSLGKKEVVENGGLNQPLSKQGTSEQ